MFYRKDTKTKKRSCGENLVHCLPSRAPIRFDSVERVQYGIAKIISTCSWISVATKPVPRQQPMQRMFPSRLHLALWFAVIVTCASVAAAVARAEVSATLDVDV